MEIDCDPQPPRCSVPARRPSRRTKRRAPRKYLARSASDLAPLIGHRRLRRLRQPFASPEGEGLDPRRGQSNIQVSVLAAEPPPSRLVMVGRFRPPSVVVLTRISAPTLAPLASNICALIVKSPGMPMLIQVKLAQVTTKQPVGKFGDGGEAWRPWHRGVDALVTNLNAGGVKHLHPNAVGENDKSAVRQ